jgi:putative flippase GtrA
MKRIAKEAIGYAAASCGAFVVDVAILWILVHFLSWDYLAAATTSFLAGGIAAYELSVRLAFTEHKLQDRRVEFVTFIALGSVGLTVNALVIFVAVHHLAMHYLVAKCVAAGFTLVCNFVMRRQILFVRHSSV